MKRRVSNFIIRTPRPTLHVTDRVWSKSNETDFIFKKKFLLTFLGSNLFPFQVGPFRSDSLLKAFLPSLKPLLEVFFCEFLQCVVGYGSLDAVNRLEMITS
jgi:hypothetical protein